MGQTESIRDALERLLAGTAAVTDLALIRNALDAGTIGIERGERSVELGGDANGAVVIAGDGNVVLRIGASGIGALSRVLDGLHGNRRHQLPADVPDFQGRAGQVERLTGLLVAGPGRAAITALDGMGGLGKTVLAVHVGHRLKARYPDGQLFVALAGTGAAPVSPAAAMTRVIQSFHPTASLPDDAAALAPLYRSTLDGQRVLLIFDDAADGAQVVPLIPPESCAMIVTSRRAVLPEAERIDLDLLAPAEARALLRAIVGPQRADDAALDRIAALCGCLPLALRVAGSFLRTRRLWPVADYEAALSDERARLGRLTLEGRPDLDVLASLAVSLRALVAEDAGLAGLWHQLAVFAGDFALDGAVAVWGLEAAAARDRMQALVDRAMVLFDEATGRFRLHDLMRDLAAGRVPKGSDLALPTDLAGRLSEAARRHAEHYGQVLKRANDTFLEGGEQVFAGLAVLDREWANIEAGHAWAAGRRSTNEGAAKLCVWYPLGAAHFLDLRLPARRRIEWLEAAVEAARSIGDRLGEGAALGTLGLAHAALGDARRAIGLYEQGLEIARELGDRRGEAAGLGNLGNAHAALGHAQRAIGFYEQGLEVARELGDRRGEGAALGNLGIAHAALGDAQRAIGFHKQSLEIARELGDRRGVGAALGNLGLAHAALGDAQRAIGFYERALTVAQEIGDRFGEGTALGNLGMAQAVLGDAQRAIGFYERALTVAQEVGDRRGEGAALGNLGSAHGALGDAQRAIGFFERALTVAQEIGDRFGEGNALGNLGLAQAALGDAQRAIESLTATRAIFAEIGAKHMVATTDRNISRIRTRSQIWGRSSMSDTLIIGIGFLVLVGFIAWIFRDRLEVAIEVLGLKGSIKAEGGGPPTPPTTPAAPPDGNTGQESGGRTVKVQGSADGSTIIAGDNNTVGR